MSRLKTKVIPEMLFTVDDEVKCKDVPSVTGYAIRLIKKAKVVSFKKWRTDNRLVRIRIDYVSNENRDWFNHYGIIEYVELPEFELELISPRYDDPDLFI